MFKKQQEGGFKPLWVKCSGCQKWNGVQIGIVFRYLEKLLSPAAKPVEKKAQEETSHGDD